jgi:hypothetical protein
MSSSPPASPESEPRSARRSRDWNGVAAVIAAFVGLLALCVSGYTAYLQHQQVRAQVWPYLEAGNDDSDQSLVVYNKGVGPAVVRSAQVFVDDKPLPDWSHVLTALGLEPHHFQQSTLNPSVLSPGEQLKMIKFFELERWKQFRAAAVDRVALNICFCSTLDECWMYSDRHPVGYKALAQLVEPVPLCPQVPEAETFNN